MLEEQITRAAQVAISKSIETALSGYNSPLSKLVEEVVSAHMPNLRQAVKDEISKLCDGPAFREQLGRELNAKLARTIISKMDGEIEKRMNELRSNPEVRAQITLAITRILETHHG